MRLCQQLQFLKLHTALKSFNAVDQFASIQQLTHKPPEEVPEYVQLVKCHFDSHITPLVAKERAKALLTEQHQTMGKDVEEATKIENIEVEKRNPVPTPDVAI
eukprot:m.133339 g.133339  ORF g.133339 m.133339 type:complete len:103 (-) comp29669_c0_seq4:208-516(-)